jgi:hypothetical protein
VTSVAGVAQAFACALSPADLIPGTLNSTMAFQLLLMINQTHFLITPAVEEDSSASQKTFPDWLDGLPLS